MTSHRNVTGQCAPVGHGMPYDVSDLYLQSRFSREIYDGATHTINDSCVIITGVHA